MTKFYDVYVGTEPNMAEFQGEFGKFDQALAKANMLAYAGLPASVWEIDCARCKGRKVFEAVA